MGVGATTPEGQMPSATGEVLDVSRNSLFVGGGAKIANAPLTGGAGGPARLFLDLSIADALFQPLVARQMSCAAQYQQAVAFNDAQLEGALAELLMNDPNTQVFAPGLGASDARGHTHLLRVAEDMNWWHNLRNKIALFTSPKSPASSP